jgi:lipopolysaccharide/colanic/teichoic acid biosynthesis glycosyltransferase
MEKNDKMDSNESRDLKQSHKFKSIGICLRAITYADHRQAGMIFCQFLERLGAAGFLLISLPLFILIPIIIKLQDGGPVFYISRRMGKGKQLFNMYKFRSLAPDAEQKIGGELLNHNHNLEIPIGRFLRDTRLDEIPQLFNIILGGMQFFGPRPVRPLLYAGHCAQIPDYDRRFAVKPGLFGYSQIFTPHSTPKRIRALIDNRHIKRSKGISFVVFWAPVVMFYLLLRMVRKAFKIIRTRLLLKFRSSQTKERRVLERVRNRSHTMEVDEADSSTVSSNLRLIDFNDECMCLHTKEQLPDTPIRFRLTIKTDIWFSRKVDSKTVRIIGSILNHQQKGSDPYRHVISYAAYSPLNRYLIDKYILKKSII